MASKIIHAKLYDTSTATHLAHKGTLMEDDFKFETEDLYRKDNGEYFLYCEGGPMSKYTHRVSSSSWTGGEKFIPLTEEEAKSWAEDLPGEDYIDIFGDPGE